MSGQPVKTPADINKFRNEYMETLRLQEQINDMNLEANKTYLLTGQLPPQSQMQDTRTTAEKLKDVELLKQSIVSDLRPIAEPQFGMDIVNAVMNSPLNVDNSLLRYLAQRASNIANELSRIYKFGISGDANDLQIIVEFIKNMYADQQGKFQTFSTYVKSQSSQGIRGNVLSSNDIDNILLELQDILKNVILIKSSYTIDPEITNILDGIKNTLIGAKNFLPTTKQLNDIINKMSEIDEDGNILNQSINYNSMKFFFDKLEELPKTNVVMSIINKIEKYLKTKNWNLFRKSINSLNEMLYPLAELINNPQFMDMAILVNEEKKTEIEEQKLQAEQTRNFIRHQTEEEKDASKAKKVYVVNPYSDPVKISQGGMPTQSVQAQIPPNRRNTYDPFRSGIESHLGARVANNLINAYNNFDMSEALGHMGWLGATAYITPSVYNYFNSENDIPQTDYPYYNNQMGITDYVNIPEEFDYNDMPALVDISEHMPQNNPQNNPQNIPRNNSVRDIIENDEWDLNTYILKNSGGNDVFNIDSIEYDERGIPIVNFQAIGDNKIYDVPLNRVDNYFYVNNIAGLQQMNLIGHGLRKRKSMKGNGICMAEKPYNYLGFGINEINKSKLEKGILTLRRKNKTNYPDMPSRRVSSKFSNIVKTIVGGSMPKFEDLNTLDEDEKEYLTKLVKKSNLEDRLSVPAPSKDQQEKDIHNFEIMKGQLMSGNDSIELVKKFKLLIRKLSKQGLLPKADVEELNEILLELGY